MKALVAVAVMILISEVAFPALTPGVDRLAPVQIQMGPLTAAELGCPTGQGAARTGCLALVSIYNATLGRATANLTIRLDLDQAKVYPLLRRFSMTVRGRLDSVLRTADARVFAQGAAIAPVSSSLPALLRR